LTPAGELHEQLRKRKHIY